MTQQVQFNIMEHTPEVSANEFFASQNGKVSKYERVIASILGFPAGKIAMLKGTQESGPITYRIASGLKGTLKRRAGAAKKKISIKIVYDPSAPEAALFGPNEAEAPVIIYTMVEAAPLTTNGSGV